MEKCIEFSFFFNKLASRLSLCQYLSIYFLSMRIYVFYKVCSLTHKVFKRILAKNFVDSIIIATFAVEFERTEKNGRDDDSN